MNHDEIKRRFAQGGITRLMQAWLFAARQPSWISRAALIVFAIILAIPIILIVLVALMVAAVVFFVLAIVSAVMASVRSVFPKRDGRENVRVIRRDP